MRTSFPSFLRDLVLLGLAPLPVACGGATAASNPASNAEPAPDAEAPSEDGSVAIDATSPSPPVVAPVDAGPALDAGALPDVLHPPEPDFCAADAAALEGGLEYQRSCCFGGQPGPVCDPTQHEADGGACAPRWVAGDGCIGGSILYPCGVPPLASGAPPPPPPAPPPPADGATCQTLCLNPAFDSCSLELLDGGDFVDEDAGTEPVVVWCRVECTGRRPAGLVAEPRGARSVGEVLAHAAYLEAASVDAFLGLAEELAPRGAPASLLRRLRKAAGDEVRHARAVGALAEARGAAVDPVRIERRWTRSLLEIALENAREGCVRETWGAASAVAQASRAGDADVREVMEGIARDELRHAALSWDLAAWVASKLDAEERAQVAATMARAVADLEEELEGAMPETWREALGLPSREDARAILAAMRAKVWGVA
ncbi:MAG TPA: hypothetical protein VGI39_08570 [Polyangiaceae bacterium]|jgi:hypothetical protein